MIILIIKNKQILPEAEFFISMKKYTYIISILLCTICLSGCYTVKQDIDNNVIQNVIQKDIPTKTENILIEKNEPSIQINKKEEPVSPTIQENNIETIITPEQINIIETEPEIEIIPTIEIDTSEDNIIEINPIVVTLKINDSPYNTTVTEDTTVYSLMDKLTKETNFSFSGKNYSGLGYFVDKINGIKNDNSNGKYWIYYINGQSAKVGISNYIINNNDLIEWKYENSNF